MFRIKSLNESKNDKYNKKRKYRKIPLIIEAYQTDKAINIKTLEGVMRADLGNYIITGIKGEQYPCKPDIFEKTYRIVDDD